MDFADALTSGLPRHMAPVSQSGPFNSSPYMAGEAEFLRAIRSLPGRSALAARLHHAWERIRDLVDLRCTLIGGSFVDPYQASPRDVDMVAFYRAGGASGELDADALGALATQLRASGIDVRFVPGDAGESILVRLASFFTMLYMEQRGSDELSGHGLVLVTHRPPRRRGPA